MSAPASRAGKGETCPSCGLTAIVPYPVETPLDPTAESPADSKQQVHAWWTSNKRKVIIASSIIAAGLLVIWLINVLTAPNGEFPPRDELAKFLAKEGYYPFQATAVTDTLRGRRLQRFDYVVSATPGWRRLAKIELWCAIDNPSKVVGITSSVEPESGNAYASADDSELTKSNLRQSELIRRTHSWKVWTIVRRLTSIPCREIDLMELNEFHVDPTTGWRWRIYRGGGFLMEVGQNEAWKGQDKKPRYNVLMILRDKTWE